MQAPSERILGFAACGTPYAPDLIRKDASRKAPYGFSRSPLAGCGRLAADGFGQLTNARVLFVYRKFPTDFRFPAAQKFSQRSGRTLIRHRPTIADLCRIGNCPLLGKRAIECFDDAIERAAERRKLADRAGRTRPGRIERI